MPTSKNCKENVIKVIEKGSAVFEALTLRVDDPLLLMRT